MNALEMERDVVETPVVNPWRRAPSRDQIAYATDLCRSELPYAERVKTIATFAILDRQELSALIDELAEVRVQRMRRLRRRRR